ncbi:hypothetical protein HHX47_DHR4000148 [Lentinula edodes]|nr:hypothetical protein HHX47_DHR4000148 [Lentinula edodes]
MKRTLEKTQPTNFKERKKQKLADARTIAVQSPITTSNAVAGPSRLGPTVNNIRPPQLEHGKFFPDIYVVEQRVIIPGEYLSVYATKRVQRCVAYS